MKYLKIIAAVVFSVLLCGCSPSQESAQIAATTLPVWEFSSRLCEGTPLSVARLVTEPVSCLHDYSLNVRQVKAAERAETIVISGAGLEDFLDDLLLNTLGFLIGYLGYLLVKRFKKKAYTSFY